LRQDGGNTACSTTSVVVQRAVGRGVLRIHGGQPGIEPQAAGAVEWVLMFAPDLYIQINPALTLVNHDFILHTTCSF
jgi:hypothetical protein